MFPIKLITISGFKNNFNIVEWQFKREMPPHRLVSLTTWSQPVALSGKAVEIRGGQALLEDTGHSEWPRGFTTQLHFLLSDS